jgi:hypothetical protein
MKIVIMQGNWYYAPEKLNDTVTDLIPSPTKLVEGSVPIKQAMPFSIRMNGVFISKSYDEGEGFRKRHSNTNDLLVLTSFQTGTDPTVDRIHLNHPKLEYGQWVGDFFKSLVCSFSDIKYSQVTIRTHVYDIDDFDKYKETLSAVNAASGSISVTFPVIAPFTAVALPAIRGILDVINSLDSHDSIIDSNLQLSIAQENTGIKVLQTGHWIYFNKPQEEGLKLNPTLQVIGRNSDNKELFKECDYVVYSIRAEEAQEPEWETDQKVAKLLSELGGKGNSGKSAVEFVRDTVEGYGKFKKLNRIKELEEKVDKTEEENKLLEKLKSDKSIEPFLPKP